MSKGRLEAFSDAVLAIVITIMVLELRVPHGADLRSLAPVLPIFSSYVLSFLYLAIYWNNHHHLLQTCPRVNGAILWANIHLLFWLSLVPFVTAWMGENEFAPAPVALYGGILMMAGGAYYILTRAIIALQGRDSVLQAALGRDLKGKASVILYLIAVPLAFAVRWASGAIYVLVALIWLVPDRRIERELARREAREEPSGG